MMTFCALLKTEPVGDALQLTALLQSINNDDDDDDDEVGDNIVVRLHSLCILQGGQRILGGFSNF